MERKKAPAKIAKGIKMEKSYLWRYNTERSSGGKRRERDKNFV